jgi:hypothetical protein
MKLMTKEIKLPPLYHFDKTGTEPVAVVKFFDPTGSWTWYAAEGEKQPDGNWLFWGAVDGFEFEYGYFTLHQLEHAKDGITEPLRALPIERDLHFTPTPLAEFA